MMPDTTTTDARCPRCGCYHGELDLPTKMHRYGVGYRDGLAGRYMPRSPAYAAAGYDAGNCAGAADAGVDVLYHRPGIPVA